ncbi:MAG: hypothetical protein KF715_19855 [Candidatus Didemnitutus sp.]|nr:hypothetical protein [Candidatus Didemnitutus sp.]
MSILHELEASSPRPAIDASREEKKNYAERLSRHLALKFANALRRDFEGILPNADGTRQESQARTARGVKKLDVNYSTPELGLGLGVSIKTINYADATTGRFTKNYSRVENELRAEADDYHQRQPYAVLTGVIYLPLTSCHDSRDISSFGSAVRYFRHRANRREPDDPTDRFERLFIGVYDERSGDDWYLDVLSPPPRRGVPAAGSLLTFARLIDEIRDTYDLRNNPPFIWADEQA